MTEFTVEIYGTEEIEAKTEAEALRVARDAVKHGVVSFEYSAQEND